MSTGNDLLIYFCVCILFAVFKARFLTLDRCEVKSAQEEIISLAQALGQCICSNMNLFTWMFYCLVIPSILQQNIFNYIFNIPE